MEWLAGVISSPGCGCHISNKSKWTTQRRHQRLGCRVGGWVDSGSVEPAGATSHQFSSQLIFVLHYIRLARSLIGWSSVSRVGLPLSGAHCSVRCGLNSADAMRWMLYCLTSGSAEYSSVLRHRACRAVHGCGVVGRKAINCRVRTAISLLCGVAVFHLESVTARS